MSFFRVRCLLFFMCLSRFEKRPPKSNDISVEPTLRSRAIASSEGDCSAGCHRVPPEARSFRETAS
jgi:hypothetical protein